VSSASYYLRHIQQNVTDFVSKNDIETHYNPQNIPDQEIRLIPALWNDYT